MKKNAKVDVIIPLYNNEQYIGRCVESLLMQNYDNYKIIIVDDGSTDCSFDIALKYESEKVNIYRKANGGPSSARNFGIEHCSKDSEYLLFVDSDDIVSPDYVSTMVKNAAIDRLVICGIKHLHESDVSSLDILAPITEDVSIVLEKNVWQNKHIIRRLPSGIYNPSWNKCYSLRLIQNNNLKFKDQFPEDILFNISYLDVCQEVCFIDAELYYYIHREGSVSRKPKISLYEGYIDIQKYLYSKISTENHRYIEEFVYPQYLANTKRYLQTGNFVIPRQYWKNPYIKRAISSHAPTCFGDGLIKYLFKWGWFKLLIML